MKKSIFYVLTSLLFLSSLTACHSIQYVNQVNDQAYLQFSGDFSDIVVEFDDKTITLDETTKTFELNGKRVAKFPVSIGAHTLKVTRDGVVLINKNLLTAHGQTAEVNIP